MPDISKLVLPDDNNTYELISKKTRGLIRATKESNSTSTSFVLTAPGVGALYDAQPNSFWHIVLHFLSRMLQDYRR